jgi:hypothetical protein
MWETKKGRLLMIIIETQESKWQEVKQYKETR